MVSIHLLKAGLAWTLALNLALTLAGMMLAGFES